MLTSIFSVAMHIFYMLLLHVHEPARTPLHMYMS